MPALRRLFHHSGKVRIRRALPLTDEVQTLVDYTNADVFQREIATSKQPILVQFSADWCGPCQAMAPMMDEIIAEYDGKLTVLKLNMDEIGPLAKECNVRSIPTLILYKNGVPAARFEEQRTLSRLSAFLDKHLGVDA